ncbi:MAG: hypothetical protein HUJ60_01865 [Bacilli bacterium]|nr:hypothetical protein [Bacilli bacterium]
MIDARKRHLLLLLPLAVSACGQDNRHSSDSPSDAANPSVSTSATSVASSFDNGYHPVEGEDFDPEASYDGMLMEDFRCMTQKYSYCAGMGWMNASGQYDFLWPDDGTLLGFSYNNTDIFATRSKGGPGRVEQFTVLPKKRLTITEARDFGFFGSKRTSQGTMWYKFDGRCVGTETYWTSEFDNLEKTIESLSRFGVWDSLMVFLDRRACEAGIMRCLANGLGAVLYPAYTIYSDDLSEVVGVSVPVDNRRLWTYMKEDGYDQKITPEEYASGVKRAEETGESFGRAAFYFTPDEFKPLGLTAFFDLLGGPIDLDPIVATPIFGALRIN